MCPIALPKVIWRSLYINNICIGSVQFSCSVVSDPANPCITARQASLSITNSWSSLKLMSIESVMPSSHLILCPSFLLPAIPPSIRIFSKWLSSSRQVAQWGVGFSASTSVLPMNTQDSSPLGWTDWISLKSKGLSRAFSNTTVQKHQFFGAQISLESTSHIHTWLLEKL